MLLLGKSHSTSKHIKHITHSAGNVSFGIVSYAKEQTEEEFTQIIFLLVPLTTLSNCTEPPIKSMLLELLLFFNIALPVCTASGP